MLTMEEVYLGVKRTDDFPFTIVEKLLIVIGEVDIGLIPVTLPLLT